jgi:putative ABC transport system permease protein
MLPIEDLQRIDGVDQVARVGHYPARIVLQSQRVEGTILGVDRAAMAEVTLARQDYAPQPMADLFNQLASNRAGALINLATLQKYNFRIGQVLSVQVSALNTWYDMKVPILGVFNYFPTYDPSKGFLLIGNLDPIFETVGTLLPYDYWLSLKPSADPSKVRDAAINLGYPILEWRDPQAALHAAQASPSRRGVLGFLSVGFVAAIVLTLVAAIIQTTAAFRAQSTQLGSLRAMGLGGWSVGTYLTLVQGVAAMSGILSGTSIGVGVTLLFLPLLDFSGGLPPYLVRVDWGDITLVYAVFAGVLFAVTVLTTMFLGRESLSAIVRLGEG